MKKIIILTLILLITFSSSAFAFFGLFEDAISSLSPQPMYRVPSGQELEYMAKTIKQVQLMIEQAQKLKNMEEQGLDQQALMSKMLGNTQLAGIVGGDISNYTADDWENLVYDNINDLFDKLNNTFEETTELPDDIKEKTKEQVESRLETLDTSLEDLESQLEDGNIATYDREEREEIFKKKIEELSKKLDLTVEYYVEIDQTYGENSEYEKYIKKEEQVLNDLTQTMGDNFDKATLPMAVKSLNVLMAQNNRINLKIVKALSDLNEQTGRVGEIQSKEQIGNEFNEIDLKYNN